MADELSDEERELIDRAIRSGMVRRIGRGVSSHSGYIFTDGKLRAIDQADAGWRRMRSDSKRAAASRRIEARREKVLLLFSKGLSCRAIARRLDVNHKTISSDARALGLKFKKMNRHG